MAPSSRSHTPPTEISAFSALQFTRALQIPAAQPLKFQHLQLQHLHPQFRPRGSQKPPGFAALAFTALPALWFTEAFGGPEPTEIQGKS